MNHENTVIPDLPVERVRGFVIWNRALQGAYRKGWSVFHTGVERSACPYVDRRKASGRLTWSRAFRTAWRDGWDFARGLTASA